MRLLSALLLAVVLVASAGPSAAAEKRPEVDIDTSMGLIRVQLYADKAPITVKNFLAYVQKGHYNGTLFHRVVNDTLIQGGGFSKEWDEKPTDPPIKNEASSDLKNVKGTIAMARTAVLDSATAQFFINAKDNPEFDHQDRTEKGFGYAVFGKVTKGMDVVQKIARVSTTVFGRMREVPLKPVVINSITLRTRGSR
jgi:cyclophilin family peptidyl-prolyl cis-trans isomerase